MDTNILDKIKLHEAFWKREPMDRPILAFRHGDRFPYDKMRASRALMQHGMVITPDMVDVDAFCDQTEEELAFSADMQAQNGAKAGDRSYNDTLRGVSPFGGIPWMECLLGCGVMALDHSIVSMPCQKTPGDPDKTRINEAWYNKYVEFLEKYSARFGDAYPVTESLMRGCLDVYGAMIGQEEMIYAFFDEPGTVAEILDRINRVHVEIVNLTLSYSKKIHGGMLHSYGLWAPGTVNQFQEDLCALVTPKQMNDFVVPLHSRMCGHFDYNAVHTHPTSYHAMPEQLSVEKLQLVQVQRDEGDPPIFNCLDVYKSVQEAGKCLLVSADLSYDEVAALIETLDVRGLYLMITLDDSDTPARMYDFICEACAKKKN